MPTKDIHLKKEAELRNQLKAVRTRLGISQQDLATTAGVARQTIGGIESGTYALSLTVALRLAKALGCPVEELFWLEDDLPTVEASLTGELGRDAENAPVRVSLAQVGGKWIAAPLVGDQAFRREMIPADGIGEWNPETATFSVCLLDTPEALAQTVRLAGCTPALSLWARSAERWYPGLRVHWLHANSMAALTLLARGEIHIAGIHLIDLETGEENPAFVQRIMGNIPTTLVNLGTWQEGFVVAPGNPKGIRSGADLTQSHITFINREEGAGARLLLDSHLKSQGIPLTAIAGYDHIAHSHMEVAREIASGCADVGVSNAGIATLYGLAFIPLHTVNYDLAIRQESLELPAVQQLLSTLHHRWVRSQLAVW